MTKPRRATLVTGRSLRNYADCGKVPPPDSVVELCIRCTDPLTITPSGAATLKEARERGDWLAGAICTPCIKALPLAGASVSMTASGAELIRENPYAADVISETIRRTAEKKRER